MRRGQAAKHHRRRRDGRKLTRDDNFVGHGSGLLPTGAWQFADRKLRQAGPDTVRRSEIQHQAEHDSFDVLRLDLADARNMRSARGTARPKRDKDQGQAHEEPTVGLHPSFSWRVPRPGLK